MVVTNKFLENIGINAIRGGDAAKPTDMFWAGSDNTFIGDEVAISNPKFTKGVVWFADGIDSVFNMELNTTDAIGSYLEAYGLTDSPVIGTGSPLLIVPSDIGTKSSRFSVEISGSILFRRAG